MKRAERMQDRGANPLTSTIRTPGYDLLERCRLDHRIAKVEYPTRKTSLGCSYDGGELGSTGAESKWRQTGWSRKDQTKLKANNYVAPKTYALAA